MAQVPLVLLHKLALLKLSIDGTTDILNNNNSSEKQARHGEKVGKAMMLVDYSDSEDDEI